MKMFRSTSALALTVLLSIAPAAKADLKNDAILLAAGAVATHVVFVNPATPQNKLSQAIIDQQSKVPFANAAHQKLYNGVQWVKANAFEVGVVASTVALINHKLENKPFRAIENVGGLARLLAEKLSAYSGVVAHLIKQ